MIFAAVDLQNRRVAQLVQGEHTALERDLEETLAWLEGFAWLQVVDLDAARGRGANPELVRRCCGAGFRVRVGGGVRSRARAEELLALGAEQVIVGTAAWRGGAPDQAFLEDLQALGRERIVLAVDGRGGRVVNQGWRRAEALTPLDAVRALEPWCGGFLYTHIESEGRMQGLPLEPVRALRAATVRRLCVAGGIASCAEVAGLEALGCDCVLGMALYTGRLRRDELLGQASPRPA